MACVRRGLLWVGMRALMLMIWVLILMTAVQQLMALLQHAWLLPSLLLLLLLLFLLLLLLLLLLVLLQVMECLLAALEASQVSSNC